MKDWADGGGITLLIERLKAVYNTLARIVGIADSVGHGLRRMWDGATTSLPQVDEYGRVIQPATPNTGLLPPATVPTMPGADTRGLGERSAPFRVGGRDVPAAVPGHYDYSTPRERIGAGVLLGRGTPAPTSAEQDARGRQARDTLVGLGWSPAQAAGIVANLHKESGFNPGAVGDGGAAYGIAQWHPDRRAAIERGTGKSLIGASFDEQLRALDYELRHNESGAGDRLRATRTAAEAGAVVSRFYERPADVYGEASARAAGAARWDARLGAPTDPLTVPAAPVAPAPPVTPVPAMASAGAQGQPGPDGRATVRLTFDNPPPGLRTSSVSQGPLRIETPHFDNSP